MPSILTCAIIILYEHQPVSTVCACMARQRSWNFYLKTGPLFCQLNLWKSSVYVCCCLVKWMRRSIKLEHNWPGSLKNTIYDKLLDSTLVQFLCSESIDNQVCTWIYTVINHEFILCTDGWWVHSVVWILGFKTTFNLWEKVLPNGNISQ